MSWTTNAATTGTRHSPNCGRVFRNYDMSCPRCRELAEGFTARAGWGDNARQAERMRCAAIRAHNCAVAGCGPVCTFGDW